MRVESKERAYYGFEPFYLRELDIDEGMLALMEDVLAVLKPWVVRVEAEVLHPLEGLGKEHLTLSGGIEELDGVLEWLTERSFCASPYEESLYLIDETGERFGQFHEGPRVNWGVYVTADVFGQIQTGLVASGYPADLFNDDDPVCVPVENRVMRAIGFKKCYSQKEWEAMNAE